MNDLRTVGLLSLISSLTPFYVYFLSSRSAILDKGSEPVVIETPGRAVCKHQYYERGPNDCDSIVPLSAGAGPLSELAEPIERPNKQVPVGLFTGPAFVRPYVLFQFLRLRHGLALYCHSGGVNRSERRKTNKIILPIIALSTFGFLSINLLYRPEIYTDSV